MLINSNPVISQILISALLWFLLIGGIVSVLVGIALIFRHEWLFRAFGYMNRWVSCRRAMRPLEITRDSWPFIEQFRYLLSVFLTTGAAYVVYWLLTQMDMGALVGLIGSSPGFPKIIIYWLVDSVRWFFILVSAMGIIIGVMLAFSLTALRQAEVYFSRWISTRNTLVAKKSEAMHLGADHLIVTFPKIAGIIITLMSILEVYLVYLPMR